MDLKNIILSTLSEIENDEPLIDDGKDLNIKDEKDYLKDLEVENLKANRDIEESEDYKSDEERFLKSLRERVLVLFEGFQAPNNRSLEAKVDLTLNFLEYLLAVIDERLSKIEHKD